MPRSVVVMFAATCVFLSGCGTFSDAMCGPIDDHVFYRGVRLDFQAAKEGGSKTLMLADIPFSAVADTILIPYYARRCPALPHADIDSVTGGQPTADKLKTVPRP